MGSYGLSCLRGCEMCFINDCEGVSLTKNENRTCRKAGRCNICFKEITPGQQYEYSSWLFEHKFEQTKTCNLCVQDRYRIIKYELLEGCGINEAYPDPDDQIDWLHNSHDVRRATRHVDLRSLSHNLRVFAGRLRIRKAKKETT